MPLSPEEPQILESVPGPRVHPAAGRTASTPRPVPRPGPRPGPPRPKPPAPTVGPSTVPAQRTPAEPVAVPPVAAPAPEAAPAASAPAAPPVAAPAAPQLQLIPATADGALDAADEAVDLLLDSGRAPEDILVLTTGEQHPWAAHELSFGETAYWAQHDARDDVFYADSATTDRAAIRPVVIVAVNGGPDDAATRALPAAMGRAGALLIVCGDPARINSVLGAGV